MFFSPLIKLFFSDRFSFKSHFILGTLAEVRGQTGMKCAWMRDIREFVVLGVMVTFNS